LQRCCLDLQDEVIAAEKKKSSRMIKILEALNKNINPNMALVPVVKLSILIQRKDKFSTFAKINW
jgi:hypothetical protein